MKIVNSTMYLQYMLSPLYIFSYTFANTFVSEYHEEIRYHDDVVLCDRFKSRIYSRLLLHNRPGVLVGVLHRSVHVFIHVCIQNTNIFHHANNEIR